MRARIRFGPINDPRTSKTPENDRQVVLMVNVMKSSVTSIASIAIIAALAAPCAGQTVNKCVDANGKVSYGEADCSGQRKVINVSPNTIGDGGAAIAKKTLQSEIVANHKDQAYRRYRDATDLVGRLRAILDNNDATKQSEMAEIMEEQRKCRHAGNFSRRCHDLDALKQSDIDSKYHQIWMRTHSEWSRALTERTNATKALIALGETVPQ